VAGYADGVIVGSAFVRRILQAETPAEARDQVRALASELAGGVRAAQ
jgi:tryptophan synthase alpha chain